MSRKLFIILAVCSLALVGCKKKVTEDEKQAVERAIDQTYIADFTNPDILATDWVITTGTWAFEDGTLVGGIDIPYRAQIWLQKPLSNDIEIRFEIEAVDKAQDINCFVAGDGKDWSGYEIMIGGHNGTRAGISWAHFNARGDQAKKEIVGTTLELEKDKVYDVRIRRKPQSIQVDLDGKEILLDQEEAIKHGTANQYFGFGTWDNTIRIHSLRIDNRQKSS